jgi:hypothetical protein
LNRSFKAFSRNLVLLADTNSNSEDLSTARALRILADFLRKMTGCLGRLLARQPILPERSFRSRSRSQLAKGLISPSCLIAAALTMGRHHDKTADTGGEFRAPRRRRANPGARRRNLQSADQRRTDGGDEARASREVKQAEAELDHPEDNARGRSFCGWVVETRD